MKRVLLVAIVLLLALPVAVRADPPPVNGKPDGVWRGSGPIIAMYPGFSGVSHSETCPGFGPPTLTFEGDAHWNYKSWIWNPTEPPGGQYRGFISLDATAVTSEHTYRMRERFALPLGPWDEWYLGGAYMRIVRDDGLVLHGEAMAHISVVEPLRILVGWAWGHQPACD